MRPLVVTLSLCATACVTPAGSQTARDADCAAATFTDDPLIGPAFTDRFNGRYWNNSEQVIVGREGQRLYIGRTGQTRVQLKPASRLQGAGAFRDACRTTYEFILPPDGPGGYLIITEQNGAQSEWHRRV